MESQTRVRETVPVEGRDLTVGPVEEPLSSREVTLADGRRLGRSDTETGPVPPPRVKGRFEGVDLLL